MNSVRFHTVYELNRHKVESYILKYGHTKCGRNVICNYFENDIADRLQGTFTVSFAIHVGVRMHVRFYYCVLFYISLFFLLLFIF